MNGTGVFRFIEVVLAYARLANVEMNQIADDDLDLSL